MANGWHIDIQQWMKKYQNSWWQIIKKLYIMKYILVDTVYVFKIVRTMKEKIWNKNKKKDNKECMNERSSVQFVLFPKAMTGSQWDVWL